MIGASHTPPLHAQEPQASMPERLQAEQAIRHLMMHTFDKPQERLSVEPVVVRGHHAVAGWFQGGGGGRALLVRDGAQETWRILLCAGDGLRDASMLRTSGVPGAEAHALARALSEAEDALPADRRALLSSFQGVVHLGAEGHHPPTAHHGKH